MKQNIDKSSPINNTCHAHSPHHNIQQLILGNAATAVHQRRCTVWSFLLNVCCSCWTVIATNWH